MKGKRSLLVLVLLGLIMMAIHLRSAGAETTNCTAITSLPYTISTQGIYCLTADLSTEYDLRQCNRDQHQQCGH